MEFPKGYFPHFNLCDAILKHLNTPDMAWSNLDRTHLAEPDTQIFSCLKQLASDGYIERENENSKRSKITVSGSYFINNNGYKEKILSEQIDKRFENLKTSEFRMALLSSILTGVMAYGSIGVLYFEYVKHNHHYPYGLKIWTIFSALTAGILLTLILVLLGIWVYRILCQGKRKS